MVMVFIHGKMVIDMKVHGRWHLNMVLGQIFSLMVIYILANMKKENIMVKVNIHGAMVQFILEILKMDLNMEKVNGVVEKVIIQIFMKEIIKMIARMELGNLLGQAEMFTRENLKMMSVKVMVRCTGQMVVVTKVNGLMVFNMAMVE